MLDDKDIAKSVGKFQSRYQFIFLSIHKALVQIGRTVGAPFLWLDDELNATAIFKRAKIPVAKGETISLEEKSKYESLWK